MLCLINPKEDEFIAVINMIGRYLRQKDKDRVVITQGQPPADEEGHQGGHRHIHKGESPQRESQG